LRILYIITRSDVIGGASVHLLDLASGVQKAGHEVIIVVGGNGVFVDRAREQGLQCISTIHLVRALSATSDFRGYLALKSIISSWKPDLVHAHSSKAGILGRLAAKRLSIPCVFTAHGWAFTEGVSSSRRLLYRWIERGFAYYATKIITVSRYDRDLALRSNVGDSELIVTVHNGMPSVGIDVGFERSTRVTRIIMVARFDAPKDHAFLVYALAMLARNDWSMEFVGDGPYLPTVKQLVRDLDLEQQITFPGACSDVARRLSSSDIFCLISNWEGLPLTVLEAMRSGLPVIASSVGGVPEAVEHMDTGILVAKHDKNGLVAALNKLIDSPALRLKMGDKGRSKFLNEFTFDLMLERTINVYLDAIKV